VRSEDILGWYEELLRLTQRMLEAAAGNDWSAVVQLDGEREGVVGQIREHDPHPARDAGTRDRKREIIGRTVQLDRQVQLLTQDWTQALGEAIGGLDEPED
jgi:hypothetical protein